MAWIFNIFFSYYRNKHLIGSIECGLSPQSYYKLKCFGVNGLNKAKVASKLRARYFPGVDWKVGNDNLQ